MRAGSWQKGRASSARRAGRGRSVRTGGACAAGPPGRGRGRTGGVRATTHHRFTPQLHGCRCRFDWSLAHGSVDVGDESRQRSTTADVAEIEALADLGGANSDEEAAAQLLDLDLGMASPVVVVRQHLFILWPARDLPASASAFTRSGVSRRRTPRSSLSSRRQRKRSRKRERRARTPKRNTRPTRRRTAMMQATWPQRRSPA